MQFGESVSDVIRRNGTCPLKLEKIPGADAPDCHIFLGPDCGEYEGPCSYREKGLSELAHYPLGD